MTVLTQITRATYTTDGSSVAFATTYPFLLATDLQVYLTPNGGTPALLQLTVDYTVSGGSGALGTVMMNVAPATGGQLLIARVMPFTQPTDYTNNDNSDAEVIETSFDRATMLEQQNLEAINRVAILPISFTGAFNPTLPNPVAGTSLVFNTNGNGWAIGPTTTDVANAQANAATSATDAAAAVASATAAAVSAAAAAASAGSVSAPMVRTLAANFEVLSSAVQFSERYVSCSTHNLIVDGNADVTII